MKPVTALLVGGLLLGVTFACSSRRDVSVGADCSTGFCEPSPEPQGFADAGVDPDADTDPRAGMCPSTKCESGYTTCPTSSFACDVDLRRDRWNCGACGVTCPDPSGQVKGQAACIEGECTILCSVGMMNCDGIPDNGCETAVTTDPLHCGGCGTECAAGEQCVRGKCQGCLAPTTSCGGRCVDPSSDDANCGTCGTSCEAQQPPDFEEHPFVYFGCRAAECGTKCAAGMGDCNGDLSDGCEVFLASPNDDHCGACGVKCGPGEKCRFGDDNKLHCGCDPGLANCHAAPDLQLLCVDLSSDRSNCGGCGIVCQNGTCVSGICRLTCPPGYADCNGVAADGCEKNLGADPDHCGACGNVCSGAPGQPCVAGHCAVEECGGPK